MSQQSEALQDNGNFGSPEHNEVLALDGLEHLFKWASDVVAEGEDTRVRLAREKRIRRQVLEVVQKVREQKIVADMKDENMYLQRRVMALLQKTQELTEEVSTLKQLTVGQWYEIQRIPAMAEEIKILRTIEYEREAAVTERRYLMDALARIKVDRDYLEELLITNEDENTRLAKLLKDARAEIQVLKARRWWHLFFPPVDKQ